MTLNPQITIRNRRILVWLRYSGKNAVTARLTYWLRSVWWRLTGK